VRLRLRGCIAALALSALQGCASWPPALPDGGQLPSLPALREEPPPPALPALVEEPAADLPAPRRLRIVSGEYRAIPLQWDPLLQTEVAGYAVERAAAEEGPFVRVAELWGRGETSYVDGSSVQPLGDGQTAWYRLRAFAADGRLAAETSPTVSATTAPLPDPPPAFRAYSRQPQEIPLAWRPSESSAAVGYVVERSPSPEGPWQVVARPSGRFATSFVDRGLGDLRVLHYRISTHNAAGDAGEPSAPVRAMTKPEPLPPLDLRLLEAGLGWVALTWEPNLEPDIAEYRLYRVRKSRVPRLIATAPPDARRIEDRLVEAGESSRYALRAVDRDGLESRFSVPVVASGLGYELEAELEPGAVALRWNPHPEEFSEARILRESWLGQQELARAPVSLYVDRDVVPGRSYRYVVVLVRPDGSEAPPSQPLDVRIPESRDFR
jgi:fibronectin type 3 domain-containing protein